MARAVLLVGGLGTRLRPLTYAIPKPLAPVANRPLVWYSLRMLSLGGVGQACIASRYMADSFREAFAEPVAGLPEVGVVEETEPLDTAGAIRNTQPSADEQFIAMNGDQIMDVDVRALLAQHRETEADLTIVVRRVPDVSAFGLVVVSDEGRVEGFLEKRPQDPTGKNLINSGMYVFSPSALEAIPPGVPYSNERDLFPGLVEAGKRVLAFRMADEAYWADVGTPGKYLDANKCVLNGALPWVEAAGISDDAEVAGTVVEPVAMAAGCLVEAGAEVGPSVSLAEGAVVGEGAKVRSSIVWAGAEVGRGCRLENVIVGPGHRVPDGTVHLGDEAAILADGTMETDEK